MPASPSSIADVSISLPTLSELIAVLTFQAGFNSAVVVVGATLLGVAAGTIGTFAVLRNRALMGDALAHSALPGLAAAFIIGAFLGIEAKSMWLLLFGATVSGILGVLCVQALSRYTRLQEDAAIGAVLSCFFGAGIVLMSIIQSLGTGEEGGLHHFIFGQTAAMNRHDAYLTLSVALCAIVVCLTLFKEFRLVSFDRDFARSEGWPVSLVDLAMMSIVVVVTVIGLQAVGLLLIIALLIIPPVAARFWTESLRTMTIMSASIGGLSGYLGSSASALLPRLPAGAVIVLIAGTIFFLSFLFAPQRGLCARLLAQLRMMLRVTEDHLLREIYELTEVEGVPPARGFVRLRYIPLSRAWTASFRWVILSLLRSKGYVESRSEGNELLVRLLPAGLAQAKQRVRNHRLWEEYVATQMEVPLSHVDYSADIVEHVLSSELVAQLEQSLEKRYLRPDSGALPHSLHPIGKEG